jgi:hypothetical protein
LLTQTCDCLILAACFKRHTWGTTNVARKRRRGKRGHCQWLQSTSKSARSCRMWTHDTGTLRGTAGPVQARSTAWEGMQGASGKRHLCRRLPEQKRGPTPQPDETVSSGHVCACASRIRHCGVHPRTVRQDTQLAAICSALWRGQKCRGAAQSPRHEGKGPQEVRRQTFERRPGTKQSPRQQSFVGAPVRIETSACVRRHWRPPPSDERQRSPTGSTCTHARLRCVPSPRPLRRSTPRTRCRCPSCLCAAKRCSISALCTPPPS